MNSDDVQMKHLINEMLYEPKQSDRYKPKVVTYLPKKKVELERTINDHRRRSN